MSATDTMTPALDPRETVTRLFARRRAVSLGLPAMVLAYLVYVFFAFDVPGIAQRARMDNAAILLGDVWSYKTHVVQDARSGTLSVVIEGESKGRYPEGRFPDWVQTGEGETARIDLGRGQVAEIRDRSLTVTLPGGQVITARPTADGVEAMLPDDLPPGTRVNEGASRVQVHLDGVRVLVTRTKIELMRYFPGWEMFWFDLDSPFHYMGWPERIGLVFSGDEVRPGQSNLSAMVGDIVSNRVWRHGDVFWALGETVLMAFFGTLGAALVAIPLAFMAARDFAPSRAVRFGLRRVFDFVRGVDGLIWTIILVRAFGQGPMTGALAMLITDSGSFGKLFSEALENTDKKQVEGIRSTGANAMQRYRFGVIPQVVPVFLSQILYFLESNTRSATIIGAIVGGGIGLMLTQAIGTQKDWEKVSYYIVLIVIMVMVMDSLSGWLRRKLIKGE